MRKKDNIKDILYTICLGLYLVSAMMVLTGFGWQYTSWIIGLCLLLAGTIIAMDKETRAKGFMCIPCGIIWMFAGLSIPWKLFVIAVLGLLVRTAPKDTRPTTKNKKPKGPLKPI